MSLEIGWSMNDELIKLKEQEKKLGVNNLDRVVLHGKGLLSLVPTIGSYLAELLAFHIPNQRIDRLEDFTKTLAVVVDDLPETIQIELENKFKEKDSFLFIAQILRQVVEDDSKERLKYLASALKNGLTTDTDSINRKRFLEIISQLNEIEILRLYGASLDDRKAYEAFYKKYGDVLFYEPKWDATEDEIERHEIIKNYSRNLVQKNLMSQTNVSGEPTALGYAILKFIDAQKNIQF